jgi:hypothetical protein
MREHVLEMQPIDDWERRSLQQRHRDLKADEIVVLRGAYRFFATCNVSNPNSVFKCAVVSCA